MAQNIENKDSQVDNQINIGENHGSIQVHKKTRFSKRFEKLNNEVMADERYDGTMTDLKRYLTKLDGVDMPTKLRDGGFSDSEILRATRRKENYWKKLEKNRFFESAQWINSQLFARIMMDFEEHVERPLINNGASKNEILTAVDEKIVNPTLQLLNEEGEQDVVLNFNAEDIYGMIYYLTGKCHLNWVDYDSI